MNKMLNPSKAIAAISLIPESAPFDTEQRAWLNGFFAGMTGIEEMMAQGDGEFGTALAEPEVEEEEDFPWHDDMLSIDERMELAADKPQERKLMAAMAQLDCGSCGYLCQTYAEAIATGEETNLTLCTPGGKETAKMVKKLVKMGGEVAVKSTGKASASADDGYSRKNPFTAKLIKSEKLTGEASNKDVRHVEIDLSGSGLRYEVGDALGLIPTNCPDLVDQILSFCQCDDKASAAERLLAYDLSTATEELCELIQSKATEPNDIERARQLAQDDDQLDELDVLDFLQLFSECEITVDQLINTLTELNPRLYSIASSLNAHPDQVHLTVGKVTYEKNDRMRKGVASTFLADRVEEGSPSEGFRTSVTWIHGSLR